MKIGAIHLSSGFVKEHRVLSRKIQLKLSKTVGLLLKNPLHPSLRLHKLSGKLDDHWSISINKQYRVIFQKMENGDILLVSIGTHAIYK
jgi:addiction module RelE/StbE family toxin